jgi:hypothetical protein
LENAGAAVFSLRLYLLDTNLIFDILYDKKERRALLLDLLNQGHVLACGPINASEIYARVRPKEETATEEFLRSLKYFDIPWPVARQTGLSFSTCLFRGFRFACKQPLPVGEGDGVDVRGRRAVSSQPSVHTEHRAGLQIFLSPSASDQRIP